MILHNDHSLRIGTGPANTRKHVFKISRARQVPLLASLRPSLRTCARVLAVSALRWHCERATILEKFLRSLNCIAQITVQASKNVESTTPTILSCANISERVQHASVLVYSPCTILCTTYKAFVARETYANSRILSTKKFQTSLLQQELISRHNIAINLSKNNSCN